MLSLVSYYTCKSFKQKSSKGKKVDKKMANNLDHKSIRFPKAKKDYSKIQKKNNISINVFGYKNNLVYPVHTSKQKFEDFMDSLLINEENKSHYVYIKEFTDLYSIRQNMKIKNLFADILYSVSVVKKSWKTQKDTFRNKW